MNWFVFRRQILQTVVLSYPGVIIGAVLTMLIIKLLMAHFLIFSWIEALMFGIILSCTDTASLLYVLKRLGAPTKLSSLIEG